MLVQDPFNVAPHAKRHTRAAWVLLILSLVVALAASAALARSWRRFASAAEDLASTQRTLRAQARKEAADAAESTRKPTGEVRARLELQQVLNVSWSGLFEVLEGATKVVDGRVTVSALAPVRLRPDGAELGITALAVNSDAMLQYLQAMQTDLRVKQVQLVAQQGATANGAAVLRFQATLVLDRPVRGASPVPDRVTNAALRNVE